MDDSYRAAIGGESGVARVLAPNPSAMTGDGTNTYILGAKDVAIIDPGPADPDHVNAVLACVGDRRVHSILVTHSHRDHSAGAPVLADMTGAPVLAFGTSTAGRSETMAQLAPLVGGGEGVDAAFRPDATLADGDQVAGEGWTLRAHHTPGHMGNHMSFHWLEGDAVFTGDTVMGWSTTLISPPDGDVGQFFASLDALEALGAGRFLPGHGDAVPDPQTRCRALRAHRLAREAAILDLLDRPRAVNFLVDTLYADVPRRLHPAAARNVFAHLIHLAQTGRATGIPSLRPDALFTRR
ncbi:MAG: MBL fold metallo-hydrolase [Pseudomonadota bacterium]